MMMTKALTLIASLGGVYIPEVPKFGDKLEQYCLKGCIPRHRSRTTEVQKVGTNIIGGIRIQED